MIFGMQLIKVYACVSTKYSYYKVHVCFALMELQQLTANLKTKSIVFNLYIYDHQSNLRYGNTWKSKTSTNLRYKQMYTPSQISVH